MSVQTLNCSNEVSHKTSRVTSGSEFPEANAALLDAWLSFLPDPIILIRHSTLLLNTGTGTSNQTTILDNVYQNGFFFLARSRSRRPQLVLYPEVVIVVAGLIVALIPAGW